MFEKLPIKVLKDLIRKYMLTTKIVMSKMINGKRKTKTRKELSDELHKHLEIRADGEIIMKEHKYGKFEEFDVKKTPRAKPVKKDIKIEKKLEKAPYKFYEDFDKTIRKYLQLLSTLDEKHFKNMIKEYEKNIKILQNRKLKNPKSKEQNDDKIFNDKIYLNSFKEKLNDIPENEKKMENLFTSFQEKYKISFKEFLNKLKEEGEDIDSIRNKPNWSAYTGNSTNFTKVEQIINEIYNNL